MEQWGSPARPTGPQGPGAHDVPGGKGPGTASGPGEPAPGWYDVGVPRQLRWWDGWAWTGRWQVLRLPGRTFQLGVEGRSPGRAQAGAIIAAVVAGLCFAFVFFGAIISFLSPTGPGPGASAPLWTQVSGYLVLALPLCGGILFGFLAVVLFLEFRAIRIHERARSSALPGPPDPRRRMG